MFLLSGFTVIAIFCCTSRELAECLDFYVSFGVWSCELDVLDFESVVRLVIEGRFGWPIQARNVFDFYKVLTPLFVEMVKSFRF